jgi:predicted DNA-binding transcriptional regulator YafY
MQTFLRRLAILNYLKSQHEPIGTEQIIQHLCDAAYIGIHGTQKKSQFRLIQRDLNFLLGSEVDEGEFENNFGLTIERGSGKTRMWQLDSFSMLTYNFEQMPDYMALALAITQKHLKQVLPTETQHVLKQFFTSAESQLQKSETSLSPKHYQRLTRSVEFFQRGQQLKTPDFDMSILNSTYQAILHQKRIKLSYNSAGIYKEYDLHPFGIAIMLPKVYLVAKKDADIDKDDSAFRSFLIHKINHIEVSKLPNKVPESFELKTFLNAGNMDVLQRFDDTQSYYLTLKIHTAAHSNLLSDLKESPISPDQKLEKMKDNTWRLSANVKRTIQLKNWLLALGPQVTVISPEIIQQDLIETLQLIQANYIKV